MREAIISFPMFGENFAINPPYCISIGNFCIYFYGIIIACGLLLAVIYACRRTKQFGIKEDDVVDAVLWVTPFAILCARLYYCVFKWDIYKANPLSMLYIWEGGLAIYGGVIGAFGVVGDGGSNEIRTEVGKTQCDFYADHNQHNGGTCFGVCQIIRGGFALLVLLLGRSVCFAQQLSHQRIC